MKVLSRTLYVGIDDDPGEGPGRFFTSHINVKEARSVDNDDLGEGGNFTVYINVNWQGRQFTVCTFKETFIIKLHKESALIASVSM